MPLLEGLARGKRWCLNPKRENVDLWRRLFHQLEDHGGCLISGDLESPIRFSHVKGHSREDSWHGRCNDLADQAAKR
eukprot:1504573-Pyramimonas_sp.AAC.1